jgi:hypothetical protein
VTVDTAASFLAEKFFDDAGEPCNTDEKSPLGLNAEQKQRARQIIEEVMVRRVVEVYAEYYPDFVEPALPGDVIGRYNKPDIYPSVLNLTHGTH